MIEFPVIHKVGNSIAIKSALDLIKLLTVYNLFPLKVVQKFQIGNIRAFPN